MASAKKAKTARGSVQGLRNAETKRGVMCVIFAEPEGGGERLFLLLHRTLNWKGWEFVKGGIDEGETAEEAGKREIKEEAGLRNVEFVKALKGKHEWDAGGVHYDYAVLLFRADADEKVKLQTEPVREHDAFEWVPEGNVREMLYHDGVKRVFGKVSEACEWR